MTTLHYVYYIASNYWRMHVLGLCFFNLVRILPYMKEKTCLYSHEAPCSAPNIGAAVP